MKSIFLSLIASLGALTPLASAQNCDKFETDLIAGQHIAAGEVNVTNSGSHLRIGIRPEHGWLLEEAHTLEHLACVSHLPEYLAAC